MKDDEIVALYLQRDEAAIAETEAEYGEYCCSIARRILWSDEDAEECVSDAYLILWNSIPPEKPRSLKAFLGRIIQNASIDRLRRENAEKRGRNKELLLSELEDCIPSENDVESAVERMILGDVLDRWLSKEKPDNRKIFLCRYWYGFEYAELAERFHVREQTLMLRMHKMRKRLKKYLMKEGISV